MAEHEIDFKTTEVSTEVNTNILDEIKESFLTTSYPEKLPPKPIVSRYWNVPVETHCDASTLVFISHVNAIFNDMILNKGEKFNSENIEEYTNFLKETMTYFGDMKVSQLQRRGHKEGGWETHFLGRITWRNLRGGICPFLYFAAYLLKELPNKIDEFDYVPMLFSNQSPLEEQFSAMRSSGHNNAATYAGETTNKSVRQSNATQMRTHTYSTEDCAKECDTVITGNTGFTQ